LLRDEPRVPRSSHGATVALKVFHPFCPIPAIKVETLEGTIASEASWVARMFTGSEAAQDLVRYYWETIDACISVEVILETLRKAGFKEVKRESRFGLMSEYSGVK